MSNWNKDRFIAFGGALLCVLLILAQAWLEQTHDPGTWMRVAKDVIPNFIAALVTALLIHLLLMHGKRQRYLAALRPIRERLRDASFDPKQKREVVKIIVQAASELSFGKNEPPLSIFQTPSSEIRPLCNTCLERSDVKDGKCTYCHDIFESWRLDKQLEPSPLKQRTR